MATTYNSNQQGPGQGGYYPQQKEDAIVREVDPTDVLIARLENWRHALSLIQDYFHGELNTQKLLTKEFEKSSKIVSNPLKFDQGPDTSADQNAAAAAQRPSGEDTVGFITYAFTTLRLKGDQRISASIEAEKGIASLIPNVETLSNSVKEHIKGIKGGTAKNLKAVQQARTLTQKQIETLGHSTSAVSTHSKLDWKQDPYATKRNIIYSLNDLCRKENVHRTDLVTVDQNVSRLESHVIESLQRIFVSYNEVATRFTSSTLEGSVTTEKSFTGVNPQLNWQLFHRKNDAVFRSLQRPDRDVRNIAFENESNPATRPILSGFLQRKEGALKKSYTNGFYVITQSHYLLGYKTEDPTTDSEVEFGLYLPDCVLGPLVRDGKRKLQLHGKDVTKAVSSSLRTKTTYKFKALTDSDLSIWFKALHENSASAADAYSPNDLQNSSSNAPSPTSQQYQSSPLSANTSNGGAGVGYASQGGSQGAAPASPTAYPPTSNQQGGY